MDSVLFIFSSCFQTVSEFCRKTAMPASFFSSLHVGAKIARSMFALHSKHLAQRGY
jgi:hypothetical protein